MSVIHVFLDESGQTTRCGTLYTHQRRGRMSSTFAYADDYVGRQRSYPLEPDLPLVTGAQPATGPLPRALADSAPDRWGRRLIARQHAAGHTTGASRTLTEADYLLGVSDATRQGALRFTTETDGPFLGQGAVVPPLISLPSLLHAADSVARDDRDALAAVKTLLDAGTSSLGGARPKAAVRDGDRLLIAKFPHPQDDWDVMLWEKVALDLAAAAGITVPRNRLVRIDGASVLLLERFDRDGDRRVGYMSALTLLEADEGDAHDYLEIAEAIPEISADPRADLRELFRRIAFSIAVHNTDDHLRNHGFLRAKNGWRLSPVFDVNPNPDTTARRTTTIDGADTPAEEAAALTRTYASFGLTDEQAATTIAEVDAAVSGWRPVALAQGWKASDLAPPMGLTPPRGHQPVRCHPSV